MPPLFRCRHKWRLRVRHYTVAHRCVLASIRSRHWSSVIEASRLRSALAQMEVEGIPQARIINGCSCVHASENPQVKRAPSECSTTDVAAGEPTMDPCFDCSICLDVTVNPVVTLCGHLYCWPCIYQWMQLEHEGISNDKCPVCKARLSKDDLIPLYGRGGNGAGRNSKVLPRRQTPYLRHDHVPEVCAVDDRSSSRMSGASYNGSYQPMQQLTSESFVLVGLAKLILPLGCRPSSGNMFEETYTRRQLILIESALHQIWLVLFFSALFVFSCSS